PATRRGRPGRRRTSPRGRRRSGRPRILRPRPPSPARRPRAPSAPPAGAAPRPEATRAARLARARGLLQRSPWDSSGRILPVRPRQQQAKRTRLDPEVERRLEVIRLAVDRRADTAAGGPDPESLAGALDPAAANQAGGGV